MTAALSLLTIRSVDIDRAAAFYRALGVALHPESHGRGPVHYCGQVGETAFEIYPLRDEEPPTTSVRLGFAVAHLESELTRLSDEGVRVLSPIRETPWGRRAVVADPDGHRIELVQR